MIFYCFCCCAVNLKAKTKERHLVATCRSLCPTSAWQGSVIFVHLCAWRCTIPSVEPGQSLKMHHDITLTLILMQTVCVLVCSWLSHLLRSVLLLFFSTLIPRFASYFHHYPSDATAQHPSRQFWLSEVTHESKSMLLNSSLWSIISNLKMSSHYLRSFMHVECELHFNLFGWTHTSINDQAFCICKCIWPCCNSYKLFTNHWSFF